MRYNWAIVTRMAPHIAAKQLVYCNGKGVPLKRITIVPNYRRPVSKRTMFTLILPWRLINDWFLKKTLKLPDRGGVSLSDIYRGSSS